MEKISELTNRIQADIPEIKMRLHESMKSHTSFKIGGFVEAMYFPSSSKQLSEIYKKARDLEIDTITIGNGTNLLVQDGNLDVVVIKTYDGLSEIKRTGETEITAGSGVLLSRLAVYAMEHNLSGLEFAHGIPGTLGGAVSMNAGAYGGEMRDVIDSTIALDCDMKQYLIHGDAHRFAYRCSRFSENDDIILSSTLRLQASDSLQIKEKMDELSRKRRSSQPLNMPSAGSTFKRPKEGYAAALIEQAGLKGYALGGAQVSEKHAGFVVNRGGASFDDVLFLIDHIQETVYKQFGINLEPEIKIIK